MLNVRISAVATLLIILFSVVLAFVNASAYSYQLSLDIALAASPLRLLEVLTCFGFVNVSALATFGDPKCLTPSGDVVYESIELTLNLTIGTWVIDVGYLYYRAPVDSTILVVVEKPSKLINSTLVVEGGDGGIAVDLNSLEKQRVSAKAPETLYKLTLTIKAYSPGTEIIRIGFYLETP
jgi:hypothetical protein